MSVQAMTWALEADVGHAGAKLVLIGIANRADEFGAGAHPGIDQLCKVAGSSRASVWRWLRHLEDGGFITATERGGGRGKASIYRVEQKRCQGATVSTVETIAPEPETIAPEPINHRAGARNHRALDETRRPIDDVTTDDVLSDAPPSARPTRKSRCPEPFVVTQEMHAWREREVPAVDWRAETRKFVDYWRGTGKTMVDWEATWRNWMRRAAEGSRGYRAGSTQRRLVAHVDQDRDAPSGFLVAP